MARLSADTPCLHPGCQITDTRFGKFANIARFARIGATDHPMEKASLHHFLYRRADYWDNAENDADWFARRAALPDFRSLRAEAFLEKYA